MTRNDALKSVL